MFHWGPRCQEGSEQNEPEPEEENPEPAQDLAAQQHRTGAMMGGGEGIPLISDEPNRTPAIGTSGGGVEHGSEEATLAQEPGENGGEHKLRGDGWGRSGKRAYSGGRGYSGGPECYNCGKRGHISRKCPRFLCCNCGKPGHVKKECPEGDGGDGQYVGCKQCCEGGHMEWECPNEEVEATVYRRERPEPFTRSLKDPPKDISTRSSRLKEAFQEIVRTAFKNSATHAEMAQIAAYELTKRWSAWENEDAATGVQMWEEAKRDPKVFDGVVHSRCVSTPGQRDPRIKP